MTEPAGPVPAAAAAPPPSGPLRPMGTAHIVGAGPVGLFLAALLQSVPAQRVRLYERTETYSRTRWVSLASYLVAESIESYKEDVIDGQDVEAIFDRVELETRLAYRRSVAGDLWTLLNEWTRGFVPLNTIERDLTNLIDARGTGTVERITADLTADDAIALVGPDDILVDCTGTRSILRDRLMPGTDLPPHANTKRFRMEHALVITFLYSRHYACNEWCKYYKNLDNPVYKFIPAVHRTWYDGDVSHITGFITISPEEFKAIPPVSDGAWLREHFPEIAASMDRFIDRVSEESGGELVGDLEVTRIPLEVYHAYNATSRRWRRSGLDHPLATAPVVLLGDSAIGSPYFQSISLGLECAFFVAGHIANRAMSIDYVFDRYEDFMAQQWLRVYMRTQMIKHNKDLLQSAGDLDELLEKLHVF